MAITRHSNFDKTVNTIIDRNNISNKVNGMMVVVLDAIADPNAGSGKAIYRWESSDTSWILVSKSTTETMNFVTEELSIINGEAQLSYIPVDNTVWNGVILNGTLIYADLNLRNITISNGKISGLSSEVNGMILRVTYAYGTISQQITTAIEDTVDSVILSNLKTINGNEILGTGNIVVEGVLPDMKTINNESIIGTGNINIVTDISGKADISYVDTQISDLIGLAPATLDTLKEIADQLTIDEETVTALTTIVNNKVDKVSGKGLSTEDYTTTEKTKLASLNNYSLPVASSSVLGGVKAGTNISIDVNGVISANDTSVNWSEIQNKPTTLSGYGITDSIQSTLVSGTNIKTVNGTSILGSGDIDTTQATISGNAGTATKLQIARNIAGISFDGSADINIPFVNLSSKPTTLSGYGITDAYTKTQTDSIVNSAITNLVNGAPAALDTLKEIATQLANDESAVSALTTVVSGKANSTDVYTKTEIDNKITDIITSEFNTGVKRGSKIVYGIEVDAGLLTNSSTKDVTFTFNSTYTYWLDSQNSYAKNTSEVLPLPYSAISIGESIGVKFDLTNNLIKITSGIDRTSLSAKIVILYTK